MAPPYISSDMIFNILTRTEVAALRICRQVSKVWNDMTYESGFTQLHSERTNTIVGYFVEARAKGKYTYEFVSMDQNFDLALDFLPSPVKIQASCTQGLLFCESEDAQNVGNHRVRTYLVCKPSTGQWQIIPNPKTKYHPQGFSIMVMKLQPLHYKIVRFSFAKQSNSLWDLTTNLRSEVFDSERWSWKATNVVKLPLSDFLVTKPGRSAAGAAHWVTYNDFLFSFNVREEEWTIRPLPKQLHRAYCKHKDLFDYKGRIALACVMDSSKNNEVDLWVLYKDGEVEEWRKKGTFAIEVFPSAFYNSDIAVTTRFDEVVFHKFQDNSSEVVKLQTHASGREVFPYQSDLKPVNLRGDS